MYLRARENTSVCMVKVEGGRKGWRKKSEDFMEKWSGMCCVIERGTYGPSPHKGM